MWVAFSILRQDFKRHNAPSGWVLGLEIEVSFALANLAEVAFDPFFEFLFGECLGQFLEQSQSFLLGGRAGVVLEVLAEGEHGVGLAVLLDEAGLGQVHEVGAHAPLAVASGAEAGDVAAVDHHADDLVERAVVAQGELCAGVLLLVAARVGLAGGAELAGAVADELVAHGGLLARTYYNAGVGHGDADDGHNLHEVLVGDGVGDVLRQGEGCAFGGFDAGEGYGVWAAAEVLLEVACVFHDSEDFEAVVHQSEEHSETHVVDAALHGAVHDGEAVEVVALGGAGGMELAVLHLVVGLLEADVGADALGLQLGEVLHAHGRQLDVDAADGAALLVLGGVGAADGLHHVVGVVARAFAADEQGALVAHAQQVQRLVLNLVEGQNLALQRLVVAAETAVDAVVHAGVARVDGGEEHQALAVDFLLAVVRRVEDFANRGFVLHAEQLGHLLEVQTLQAAGLVEDVVQFAFGRRVVLQHPVELLAVDEIGVFHNVVNVLD